VPLLAALLLVIVLLVVVVGAYTHLAGRLARLEQANELLLDLVSTHMTLGPIEAARLGIAAGTRPGEESSAGQPLATRRPPPA
jgi:hypothetical protein